MVLGRPDWPRLVERAANGILRRLADRGEGVTTGRCGAVIQISVADPSGAFSFRECVIGPGAPVALALGQYATVNVDVVARSAADGSRMNTPATIQWVDALPSLPDAGLLRSPITSLVPGTEVNVPDGAFEVEVLQTTAAPGPYTISFIDYSQAGGAVTGTRSTRVLNVGDIIRTQGQTIELNAASPATGVRFYLAGL